MRKLPAAGVDVDLALAQPALEFGVAGLDVMRRIAGHNDHEIAFGRAGQLAHLGRRFREALGEPLEVVDEFRALLLVEERPVVFALFAAQLAHIGNAQRHNGQRWINLQRGKILIRKRRAYIGQSGQAQVRLVGAELPHRVVVGNARKGRGQRDPRRLEARRQKLLHHGKHVLAPREAHLQVDLRELKLAVGAQILIAEAARDLKIAVEARDHENLLEDLRRLRQRVELARMHAAGHQKIARAFRRDLGQNRRLDLQKALVAQALADGQRNVVAQAEVALHLRPAQVDVAVFEPDFFVLDGLFGRRKRRQPRVVQHQQLGRLNLDLAGRHLGIDGVRAAQAHLAHSGNHVLRPHLLALQVAVGRQLLVQHNLRDAGAVAQIEKDQVAVVAAPVHPAHQDHLLPGVGGAQVAAKMRPFETA